MFQTTIDITWRYNRSAEIQKVIMQYAGVSTC